MSTHIIHEGGVTFEPSLGTSMSAEERAAVRLSNYKTALTQLAETQLDFRPTIQLFKTAKSEEIPEKLTNLRKQSQELFNTFSKLYIKLGLHV